MVSQTERTGRQTGGRRQYPKTPFTVLVAVRWDLSSFEAAWLIYRVKRSALLSTMQRDKRQSGSKQPGVSENLTDTVCNHIDALFQDCDFITKITKLLVDSLIDPIKRAITDSITESVRNSLKFEIQDTADKLNELKDKFSNMEDTLDGQEQYSRRNCLVLFGVPENDQENVIDVVMRTFKNNLKVVVQPGDIDRTHRLGPKAIKRGKPRGIIIKFAHYHLRDKVYRAKKLLKGATPKMHILESLTSKRAKLLDDLRKNYKDKIAASWTQDGRIYLLTNNNQRHVLNKLSDAKKLRV
ncbi:hypothetical protein WMY93_029797 [Mugilogobius chulae]|uniref:Uncharacterized protein n=1 Tax=Mugilogobius chulae TaxID=88201 RepID=A0AAW0MKU4_9GOBI